MAKIGMADGREGLREISSHMAPDYIEFLMESGKVIQEKNVWEDVLGAEGIGVSPLPEDITPEVEQKIDSLGLDLCWIPSLYMGSLDELKEKGEAQFLDYIQMFYPRWTRPELLNNADLYKNSVTRSLGTDFWKLANNERMDFPQLPGDWAVVEKVSKPSMGESYNKTQAMVAMGLDDYFGVSSEGADKAIQGRFLPWFSEKTGLSVDKMDARMLTAMEWNLLANRKGWAQTNTYELTSTEVRARNGSYSERVALGSSGDVGGTGLALVPSSYKNRGIGFRPAVFFRT